MNRCSLRFTAEDEQTKRKNKMKDVEEVEDVKDVKFLLYPEIKTHPIKNLPNESI